MEKFLALLTKENIYIGIAVFAGVLLLLFLILLIQWKRVSKRKNHPKVEDYTLITKITIGEAKAKLFAAKGIHTVEDLLMTFPRSYQNRGDITPLRECTDGEVYSVVVKCTKLPTAHTNQRLSYN